MADSTIGQGCREETISVASFDTIWRLLCEQEPTVHGIKIDVQGMELEVMEGMRQTLRAWHPKLIVEFHAGVDRAQALELLTSCGYSVPGIPIDPAPNELPYPDDKSYLFLNECVGI